MHHTIFSNDLLFLGNEGVVLVVEIVEASLEFFWRDVVGTIEGSNVLAEGELKLIVHCFSLFVCRRC